MRVLSKIQEKMCVSRRCTLIGKSHTSLLIADHRPHSTEDGVLPQVGGASPATSGRTQSRRAEAVQVRRETLSRPLHRQQAQLVRTLVSFWICS